MKVLSEITSASVGFDDDGRFGFFLSFYGKEAHVSWSCYYQPPDDIVDKFSFVDRDHRVRVILSIEAALKATGKRRVIDLLGVPVELRFKHLRLISWRVLEKEKKQ